MNAAANQHTNEKQEYGVEVINLCAAPDLLEFARKTLRRLIAERECFYEGIEVMDDGTPSRQHDADELCAIDADIDECRNLIALATEQAD